MKKILITGGAGYIGSMLSTKLVELGYQVTVLDNFSFTKNSLSHLYVFKNFKLIEGDVLNKKLFKKLINQNNIIIPLAALVGAPLCEKNKKMTKELNLNSIKFLIKNLNKNHKVLYPTTNSGYGIGAKNKYCDENSELNPISLYGRTKVDAEKEILKFKNSICFRLATVFGFSYRMRSDLLVNNFVQTSVKKNFLLIYEPHFRRNYIHIRDVVNVFVYSIKNFNKMKSNTYNVGLSSANLTKIQLAKQIKVKVKSLKIKIGHNKKDPDQRDYFVSNKKIEKAGFKTQYKLKDGINELVTFFKISDDNFINNY
jgi:nucleoside-diphosphate-sugar epimerase